MCHRLLLLRETDEGGDAAAVLLDAGLEARPVPLEARPQGRGVPLRRMAAISSARAAQQAVLGLSGAGFEQAWFAWVKQRYAL